jgi:putative endonuclease
MQRWELLGCTAELKQRLARHNKGEVLATRDRLPVRLEVQIVFLNKYKAFRFEKYLKSGSGRAFLKRHL